MSRKLTTDEFIKKAKAVHGDKYDYSKVEYVNACTKVIIICPYHGEFEQATHQHLAGRGCRECGKLKMAQSHIIPHKEWLNVIQEVNPYVEVIGEIISCRTKVPCRCKICSHEWSAMPYLLKQGHGCPRCGKLKFAQSRAIAHTEWVEDITKKNTYIEIVERVKNSDTPVLARCKICSHEWLARPSHLKRGHGCPRCKGNAKRSHVEWVGHIKVVNPSIKVLGKIKNGSAKVLCRCKICDYEWSPAPIRLKQGHGCPRCANYGFLSYNHGKLYIMVDDLEVPTLMKIGISVSVEERKDRILKSAKRAGAGIYDLYLAKTWEGSTQNMADLEKSVHKAFSKYKINFPVKFDGSTEFFYYRPEVFDTVEEVYRKICGK